MSLSPAQRIARREAFMREMPNSFSDALRYVMAHRDGGAITLEELAAAAQISRKTVERYRSREQNAYDPDKVVALCIALHLPPWLSRILLDKARVTVRNWGPTGYLGEILDCCFMDTVPQVQQYLREAGYPPLKLQEA